MQRFVCGVLISSKTCHGKDRIWYKFLQFDGRSLGKSDKDKRCLQGRPESRILIVQTRALTAREFTD